VPTPKPPGQPSWGFLTNHALVLLEIAKDPDVRTRTIAPLVGVTERSVHRIVVELEEAGVIAVTRSGRRNHYRIDFQAGLRHPLLAAGRLQDLVAGLALL
jgi:predicted transcriptional regulator